MTREQTPQNLTEIVRPFSANIPIHSIGDGILVDEVFAVRYEAREGNRVELYFACSGQTRIIREKALSQEGHDKWRPRPGIGGMKLVLDWNNNVIYIGDYKWIYHVDGMDISHIIQSVRPLKITNIAKNANLKLLLSKG